MPLGPLTISAQPGPVADALRARMGLTEATGTADVTVCPGPPATAAHHVIVTAAITDELDAWDTSVEPQTVAGALWLGTGQPDAADAAVAWLILRSQTPTTPLSDLTDNNERALRWSVAAATTVDFPAPPDVEVDAEEVKTWTDAQPQVKELGDAVARTGGETADAVLANVQRLRAALAGLVEIGASGGGTDALDAAVAEHLRQVQRTGFAKWRGGKARAASLAALQTAARDVAGDRLREVMTAREHELKELARQAQDVDISTELRTEVLAAVQALSLPVVPDFAKVPRSWMSGSPEPRRYVFVHEDDLPLFADFGATVRPAPLPSGHALCAIVQSGFSLPALR